MADWLEQIEAEAVKLIPPRSPILIAVSGGVDSMVLAHRAPTSRQGKSMEAGCRPFQPPPARPGFNSGRAIGGTVLRDPSTSFPYREMETGFNSNQGTRP